MTTRRKTRRNLTMAALALAAALALPTGPAHAQMIDGSQLYEDEINDTRDNPIWCWPINWFVSCFVR